MARAHIENRVRRNSAASSDEAGRLRDVARLGATKFTGDNQIARNEFRRQPSGHAHQGDGRLFVKSLGQFRPRALGAIFSPAPMMVFAPPKAMDSIRRGVRTLRSAIAATSTDVAPEGHQGEDQSVEVVVDVEVAAGILFR